MITLKVTLRHYVYLLVIPTISTIEISWYPWDHNGQSLAIY